MSEDSDDETKKKDKGGNMNFDELMKAAVTIKTNQLAQKKVFFESLPMFLQAGLYYTKKQAELRKQTYAEKLIAHDKLKNEAGKAFAEGDFNRACRKYEEALCIWRYYYSTNPEWEKEGVDDRDLRHFEAIGDNPNEIFKIREMKLKLYLNISICSIKLKEFNTSLKACDEALRLDTKNVKGYYLKARSRILDINSGVDELKLAVRDLKEGLKIDPANKPIIEQLHKVMKLVNINSKREKETYLQMFDKNNSVEDYVKHTIKEEVKKTTADDDKIRSLIQTPNLTKRKEKFEKNVKKYVKSKELEFSFEVKKVREKVPEIEEIKETITKGEDVVELYVRTGKFAEAKQLRTSLQQARYEIEMLDCVMNLDFTRPKPKAKELAMEMGIDLTDPVVIGEFQKLQRDRLQEMKDIRDGKKKPNEQKPDTPKEDFNDIFRESNRAVFDNLIQTKNESNTEEVKSSQEGEEISIDGIENANEEAKEGNPVQRSSRNNGENDDNAENQQRDKIINLDEEEEQTFSSKKIIICSVICLFLSSLLYIFVFRS